MKPRHLLLTALVLALLLALASFGTGTPSRAQTDYELYLSFITKSECVGCDPRPTPTPRMWTHWDELE